MKLIVVGLLVLAVGASTGMPAVAMLVAIPLILLAYIID